MFSPFGPPSIGAGGDGDLAALLERRLLSGDEHHGEVLSANRLGPVQLGKGVGEAVVLLGVVQLGDELLREGDILGTGENNNCVLVRDKEQFVV